MPKFDPKAFSRIDWPQIPTVASTPGISCAMSLIRSITACVRSSEAESGSWMLTSR